MHGTLWYAGFHLYSVGFFELLEPGRVVAFTIANSWVLVLACFDLAKNQEQKDKKKYDATRGGLEKFDELPNSAFFCH